MTDGAQTENSARLAAARRLDAACDRFEAAWKAVSQGGAPPRIEDYVGDTAGAERRNLWRELILVEADYRRAIGQLPQPQEYLSRCPELGAGWLETALATAGPPTTPGPTDFNMVGTFGHPATLGRFRICGELGRGGFGIVFQAEDTRLGRFVALKLPRPETLSSPDLHQRFLREARAAAGLDHPNIVPVYDAGQESGTTYISSAFCSGGNLADWLRRQPGPVPPRRAASLVAELADAVQHAHEHGILHRDLKPANVLMPPRLGTVGGSDELEFTPRITDFGLAKLQEAADEETTSSLLLGTPAYMAPEQAAGWSQLVGPATDVYTLGVILYEMLTRQVPCRGTSQLLTLDQVRYQEPVSLTHVEAGVPRDLEVICLKCLQKAPRDRYASASALAEELRRFLCGAPIQTRPVGRLGRAARWCRRPERIRDASAVALIHGLLATAVPFLGLLSVCRGLLPAQDPAQAVAFFLVVIAGFGLPQLWVSRRAASRSLAALWIGLFLPPLFVVSQALCYAGIIPTGEMGTTEATPPTGYAQAFTVILLDILQVSIFTAALLAYRANRSLPGFLPARPSRAIR